MHPEFVSDKSYVCLSLYLLSSPCKVLVLRKNLHHHIWASNWPAERQWVLTGPEGVWPRGSSRFGTGDERDLAPLSRLGYLAMYICGTLEIADYWPGFITTVDGYLSIMVNPRRRYQHVYSSAYHANRPATQLHPPFLECAVDELSG
jgi:hypothetical protein